MYVCTYTEESFRILRRLLRELVRNVTVFICIIQKQLYKPFLRSTFLSSTMARRHSVQRLQSLHGFSSLLLHVKIDPKPDLSPPPAPPNFVADQRPHLRPPPLDHRSLQLLRIVQIVSPPIPHFLLPFIFFLSPLPFLQ